MPYEPLKISTPKPVLSWANHDLGSQEMAMAKNVASLPCVYKHVSLMPDVHLGKGALVGSVIATQEAIIPAAVGVDIGCGMGAVQTPFTADQLEGKLKKSALILKPIFLSASMKTRKLKKASTTGKAGNLLKSCTLAFNI